MMRTFECMQSSTISIRSVWRYMFMLELAKAEVCLSKHDAEVLVFIPGSVPQTQATLCQCSEL